MFEWMKSHKIISSGIIIFLFLFFIIVMPLILNWIYYLDAPCNFLAVGYDISSILNYYGAILTFIGTVSLGIITVYQNYISQKKTDEVNKLTLELQKKSMAMAEQNFNKERTYNSPKFELVNEGYNGRYANLHSALKNVSDLIVSGIKSISFEVHNESDIILITSDKVKSESSSLLSGQKTRISFNNNELVSILETSSGVQKQSLKDITLVWKFQCEDSYGNIHYYTAKLRVSDTNNFVSDLWQVEKVG